MTIIEDIRNNGKILAESGIETPLLDAEVLLSHVLSVKRVELYTDKGLLLDETNRRRFDECIKRRSSGEPIAYIIGVKEFWSMPVKVTKNVLIPRPETEHVVERALEIVGDRSRPVDILDLCTGSGNIPMALASEFPNAQFTVTDISNEALEVAKENLIFAKGRVKFLRGNLFDPLVKDGQRPFDIITANPPYARPCDAHLFSRGVVEHEPGAAIFGGTSGLDFVLKIINDGYGLLEVGGWIVMEIGFGQSEEIKSIVNAHGGYADFSIKKDLAGIDRVISMKRQGTGDWKPWKS